MSARKQSDGFTIIELMLGILATAVLVLVVSSLLFYTWASWARNRQAVELQRNASIAMRIIEHRIRNSELGSVGWTVDQINFNDGSISDFNESEISPANDVLLNSFSVQSNSAGGIIVAFSLETASRTANENFEMTIYPRNEL